MKHKTRFDLHLALCLWCDQSEWIGYLPARMTSPLEKYTLKSFIIWKLTF